jgi:hypothetical protein
MALTGALCLSLFAATGVEQCLKPVDDLGRAYLPEDAESGIK